MLKEFIKEKKEGIGRYLVQQARHGTAQKGHATALGINGPGATSDGTVVHGTVGLQPRLDHVHGVGYPTTDATS